MIGQAIRDEGPAGHQKKKGTATMGGIAVLLTFTIMASIFVDIDGKLLALLLLTVGFGIIGLLDDLIKVLLRKSDALSPSHKMSLQIIIALLFGAYILMAGHETGASGILKVFHFDLGYLYLPFVVFMIVAAANATNLTDGLDGLLAGTSVIAITSYSIIAGKLGMIDTASLCIIMAGALAGFLIFNFNPAKIFMGDCGSLAVGAFLAGMAVLLHKELLLILIGGVFVIETLSVIIQVISFKTTGRRVFKMSPLHHHFELSGMKEKKIVFMFWATGLILGILGVIIR